MTRQTETSTHAPTALPAPTAAAVIGWTGALALLAGTAAGAITGVSGAGVQIIPPPSVNPGDLESNTDVYVFNEVQDISAPFDIDINLVGTPGATAATNPGGPVGQIPFGQFISSHFLHSDQVGPGFTTLTGTVSFDREILGLQFLDAELDTTDSTLGAAGTSYPTFASRRGADWDSGFSELFSISTDGKTLRYTVGTSNVIDQVRIITRGVPTPGSAALIGLAGLAAVRRRR